MSEKNPSKSSTPRKVAGWKKLLLVLAGLFVLVGLGLSYAASQKQGDSLSTQSTGGAKTTYLTGTGAEQSSGGEDELASYSPFFVKGGLSFFVGFCLGYALRSFFKVSALAIGLVALAIFGLSYSGLVEIDWTRIDGYFNELLTRAKTEAEGFKAFITGSLPSAGLASLGLLTGFKK